MRLLTINGKMKKTSQRFLARVMNFGIVAYKSSTGRITCPFAGECASFCYARKGTYRFKNSKKAYEERYQATLKDDFIELMSANIMIENPKYVRIHDSGDFYSREYLYKWITIMNRFPDIRFYAYTNSVAIIKDAIKDLPENFDYIFSMNGKQDLLINIKKDRHAVIFSSLDDMEKSNYINSSEHDLYATRWHNNDIRVGLIKH